MAPSTQATSPQRGSTRERLRAASRDHGADARSAAVRMRSPPRPSRKRVRPPLGASPVLDLRLRVHPIHADCDHTRVAQSPGATPPLRVDGRYCRPDRCSSHRLGSAPSATCKATGGHIIEQARVSIGIGASARARARRTRSPLSTDCVTGRRKRTSRAGRKRSLPPRPPSAPLSEGRPAWGLRFTPPMHPRLKHERARP